MRVIRSPPCTYFSMLQELSKFNMRHDERWLARFNDNLIKAIDHIKFCIKLYFRQMEAGRYWLHEHPWSAKSWQIPEMEELLREDRPRNPWGSFATLEQLLTDSGGLASTTTSMSSSKEGGPKPRPCNLISYAWRCARDSRSRSSMMPVA